jgi:DNA-binding NarL/FixJ family response regulator
MYMDEHTGGLRHARIVLADEYPVMLQGMRAVLAPERAYCVVAEARHGGAAREIVERLEPDVLLLDLNMSGLPGYELIRQVLRTSPQTRIITYSTHRDVAHVSRALKCGVYGYLLKDDSSDEILRAVREVASGRHYLSPQLRYATLEDYMVVKTEPTTDQRYDRLTAREREILNLVVEGYTSPVIADRLSVSPRTVEAHRRNLQRKLGLNNVAELIRFALQHNLIPSTHSYESPASSLS